MENKIKVPPQSNPLVHENLLKLINLAVDLYQPEKIIVFGSQSRGDWRDDSDCDLLIVEPTISQKAGILHVESFKNRIRLKFDAIVAKNETISTNSTNAESVYAKALKDAFVAYEK